MLINSGTTLPLGKLLVEIILNEFNLTLNLTFWLLAKKQKTKTQKQQKQTNKTAFPK